MDGFDDWYQIYPRKEAKEAARKAYAKACRLVSPEVLIDGAKRYALSRIGQEAKYTKLPATWLNAGCWQDGNTVSWTAGELKLEQPAQHVKVFAGTPQMDAWDAYWRKTKGINAPRYHRENCFWFPTEWPPNHEVAA